MISLAAAVGIEAGVESEDFEEGIDGLAEDAVVGGGGSGGEGAVEGFGGDVEESVAAFAGDGFAGEVVGDAVGGLAVGADDGDHGRASVAVK